MYIVSAAAPPTTPLINSLAFFCWFAEDTTVAFGRPFSYALVPAMKECPFASLRERFRVSMLCYLSTVSLSSVRGSSTACMLLLAAQGWSAEDSLTSADLFSRAALSMDGRDGL